MPIYADNLADTDIADIYLADNRYRYGYADTDIQFADAAHPLGAIDRLGSLEIAAKR